MNEKGKDEQDDIETVGYRNPPTATRFKAGQSGNPKGRPKGSLSMATVLERTLRDRVMINENGRRKIITKLQAAVTQLTNKAASGDLKALQLLTVLVRAAEERATEGAPANPVVGEVDEKILLRILGRIEATNIEQGGNANETLAE